MAAKETRLHACTRRTRGMGGEMGMTMSRVVPISALRTMGGRISVADRYILRPRA